MLYAGIDLHRRYLVAAVLDSDGVLVDERRVSNDADAIGAYFRAFAEPVQAVVEAMGSWHWLYDLLTAAGIPTTLAHPLKLRAIAEAKLKNDKVDARMLAHLLRTGLVPAAYVAPPAVRTLRELLRHRAALVRIGTTLKNRVRALLAKRNVRVASCSLMTATARTELAALPLDAVARQEVTQCVALLDELAKHIGELDTAIRHRAGADAQATLLMTVPGIGYYLALLILAEVGDVTRFPSARKLASYAGLVPTTRSSGGHTYHGRITKQGSSWLRWALIEAATHLARQAGPLRRFYERHRHRKGAKIARVALARKLLVQVYWMLRNEESYDAMVRRLQTAGVSSHWHMA
jgi:transposase